MAKQSSVKEQLKMEEKLQQERVEERVSSFDKFFEENKKTIIWTVVAILLIGALILCYQKFYLQPKTAEAQEQMFPAEASFRAGEYELALNGDGNTLGFAQVIDEYGTKAGKSVYFYAGLCELQMGNYENALSYLKKYNGKDNILAAKALGAQGDALVGLERYSEALSVYDKAASKIDNIFTASLLLKAGVLCEEMGSLDKALEYYKKIKKDYPQSMEGYDIDKYITRIEASK